MAYRSYRRTYRKRRYTKRRAPRRKLRLRQPKSAKGLLTTILANAKKVKAAEKRREKNIGIRQLTRAQADQILFNYTAALEKLAAHKKAQQEAADDAAMADFMEEFEARQKATKLPDKPTAQQAAHPAAASATANELHKVNAKAAAAVAADRFIKRKVGSVASHATMGLVGEEETSALVDIAKTKLPRLF